MALHDLEEVAPCEGEGRVQLADGTKITNHTIKEKKKKKGANELDEPTKGNKKLDPDEPAPTITTSREVDHYRFPREPTIREYARYVDILI